jgi:hypothetical protein
LTSPCREALDQRNKNKSKEKEAKNPPGKKYPPKQCSPGGLFGNVLIFFLRVFELAPCRETPEYALKKEVKKKKKDACTYFFGELAQMYVGLSLFFFCRPSGQDRDREMRGSQALGFEVCLGLSLRLLASGFWLLAQALAGANQQNPAPFLTFCVSCWLLLGSCVFLL